MVKNSFTQVDRPDMTADKLGLTVILLLADPASIRAPQIEFFLKNNLQFELYLRTKSMRDNLTQPQLQPIAAPLLRWSTSHELVSPTRVFSTCSCEPSPGAEQSETTFSEVQKVCKQAQATFSLDLQAQRWQGGSSEKSLWRGSCWQGG